jgi:hypothetical protein
MRIVTFHVSAELIRDALHMPTDCYITDISLVKNHSGLVTFLFEVETSLPAGYAAEEVMPIVTHHEETFDWNWNIPEDKKE